MVSGIGEIRNNARYSVNVQATAGDGVTKVTQAITLRASGGRPAAISAVATLNLASYGITDWTPGIGVRRSAYGVYTVDTEASDLLAAQMVGKTKHQYWVDPAATGGNGTSATPYTNVSQAWGLTPTEDVIEILVRPLTSRILWGARAGTAAVSMQKLGLILRAEDNGELIIAGGTLTAPPAWTANGDGTYTCSTSVTSGTAPSAPVDWSPAARSEQAQGIGRTLTQTTGTTAANDATIRAGLQPGQAYKQLSVGTNDLTIRPFGDRALSVWQDYLVPGSIYTNIMLIKIEDAYQASPFFYMQRVVGNGGQTHIVQNRRTTAGGNPIIIYDRCAAVAGSPTSNGFMGVGAMTLYGYDCKGDAIARDFWNPHSTTTGNPTWISGQCKFVTVRTVTGTVGVDAGATDGNQDTGHENARFASINPSYGIDKGGRPGAWIDQCNGTVFGGSFAPGTSTAGTFETIQASGNAQIVLVECAIATAPNSAYDITADTVSQGATATVKCLGMTQGSLRTSGPVTFAPLPA